MICSLAYYGMMNNYNDAWISGFAGGESCFAFQVHQHSKNGYNTLSASFTIKLRKDDEEILLYLQKRFDCGSIRNVKAYAKTNEAVIFSISNIPDLLEKVIPFFEANPLLNKKQTDFEIFSQGVKYVAEIHKRGALKTEKVKGRSKWTNADWDYVKKLAKALKANRSFIS